MDTPPRRCPGCGLLPRLCLCPALAARRAQLACATRVLLVRHTAEAIKPSGTAKLVAATLPDARVVDWGLASGPHEVLAALVEAKPRGVLVFPGAGPPPPAHVDTLVVLDGTWAQAKRMLQRVPGLAAWPRLSLPAPQVALPRLRRGARPEEMSTLEAVVAALAARGEADGAAALAEVMREFVARAHVTSTKPGRRPVA